ncbi:MAG: YgfZ/GcvT domain-containing protein [Gaiellaceae bacterium]
MSRALTAGVDVGGAVYRRPRSFVAARGPDAAVYLNKMLSNEIEALAAGASCEALLLTPKARVIAMLVVYRRADDDLLLITDPGLDEALIANLMRTRFAAKVEFEHERHPSYVVLGDDVPDVAGAIVIESSEFGPGYEVIGVEPDVGARQLSESEAETLRIEAGTPRFGKEVDERVLPAEAGLIERTVDFEKGCYPGQEPIARLHYRGHTNRALRILRLETEDIPPFDAEIILGEKVVGRLTSAAAREEDVIALAYVRKEVDEDAVLEIEGVRASMIGRARP